MNPDLHSSVAHAASADSHPDSDTSRDHSAYLQIDSPRRIRAADFLLNLDELSFGNLEHTVQLTKLEARVLAVLLSHAGRCVNTAQLIAIVWNGHRDATRNTLKQIVFRLRRKLAKHPNLAAPLTSSVGGYAWLETQGTSSMSVRELLAQSAWRRPTLSL
jgi:DNA-binding response OmpR family regulator